MMKKRVNAISVFIFLMLTVIPTGIWKAKAVVLIDSETAVVDVYTQKEPHSGLGLNNVSDAFAPSEEVVLYAYVTYNQAPVQDQLVTFTIQGPANSVTNFTFSRTASTNENGVANCTFRIPCPSENLETTVFGIWKIHATVVIGEKTAEDTVTFQVGWIIEITSLKTVDLNLQPQTEFMQRTYLCANLTLKNIAITPKNATLAFVILDSLKYIVNTTLIENLEVEPGKTQLCYKIFIPEWSACGNATLHASAHKPAGPAYCPKASTTLTIILLGDLNRDRVVDIKDLATAAEAFGSSPSHPRWNRDADVNQDNIIDIRDLALIASNYGKACTK